MALALDSLKKEEGKIKKLFAAIKKLLSKEFLWLLCVALIALPLGLLATRFVESYASESQQELIGDFLDGKPLFLGCYLLSMLGVYFTRTIVGSIKTLTKKSE